jgi:hypothetical protein
MEHRYSKLNVVACLAFMLMFAIGLYYAIKGDARTARDLASLATVGMWACLIYEGVSHLRQRAIYRPSPTSAR